MKLCVLLVSCVFTFVAANGDCSWGESFWCSSLRHAKDCGAFQHCMTTVWPNQQLPVDKTDVCQYCEGMVTDVRNFLSDKQTQAQIKQYLDAACSIIPSTELSQQCKDYVDNDLEEVLDLIASELDPQTVCSLIGLCSGLEDTVQHSPTINRVPTMKIPEAQIEPICSDCKKFMQDIKDMVTSKTTEQEIVQLLETNLCSALGSFEDECKALVQAYVPELMELLTSDFDPAQICGMAGFCNSTQVNCPKSMLAKMRLQKSPLFQKVQAVGDSTECEICKTILAEVQTMDRDPKVQEEVKTFFKTEICARLGAYKDECDATVDGFAPELFELIATELDPNTRCTSLGFCQSSNKIVPKKNTNTPTKNVQASAECIVCEFVIKEVKEMLGNNKTEAEIIAALDKVCSIMPSTVKQDCMDFVNTYGRAVIVMLQSELDPDQICTALGLCKSTDLKNLPRQSEACGVCETLIGYLDAILEENSTVVDIEKALEKVCNFLPDAYRQECDTIVEQYGPMLVQLIAQYADPNEICSLLGLCKTTKATIDMVKLVPAKAHLLGTNECTYGPSYWCQNQANAEKCKAVEHCKKHVWN